MPLTPEDIEAKEFVTVLRGYDPADVQAFLRQVAGDYRELVRQVEALAQTGGDATPHIEGLLERLNIILRTATDEATEILASAERQAAEIRDGARREMGIPVPREGTEAPADAADVVRRARATLRQAVDRYRH